jgi:regulator of protease activity HflC (stomatin/prohibitin superfamily)
MSLSAACASRRNGNGGSFLRLGKLQDLRGPGLLYVIPAIESVQFIDTRTLVINIPHQKVITRDNVHAEIDSALFFQVSDAEKAVASIQDFRFGVSQYAQAALRDVVGGLTLDDCYQSESRFKRRLARLWKLRCRNGACISTRFACKMWSFPKI